MIIHATPTNGSRVRGLVEYLFGPGRSEEHTDPHVIASHDTLLLGDRAPSPLARKMLAVELDSTRITMAPEVKEKFVWHASISLAPEDGPVSEEMWRDIAESVAEHMGFGEDTPGAPVRWIAVHHGVSRNGNDHIHLMANLIAEDGRKHNFRGSPGPMLSEVRKRLEIKHGLRLVGHDKGTGLGAYSQADARRAEEERHTEAAAKGVPTASVKLAEPETVQLERKVRAAASAAVDESDFLRHLTEQEVAVRPRFATGDRSRVVGISVALPTGDGQTLIWHGGGRLAKDLTLPALRTQWNQTGEQQTAAVEVWHQVGVGGTKKADTATPAQPDTSATDQLEPAEAEQTAPPTAEPADLETRVRTAAHAATGEAEFLAQLHAQGVVVRPRFATGDSTTVVGMSVALPTGNTGNTLDWHGAGKLGKDLSLPALRERWGQTPEQQTAAVGAWRQLGAVGKQLGDRTDTDPAGKRPKNQNPDFAAAIADINTLGAYAAGLGGDDPEAAREAARQAAAVLAAAALRAHGPSGGAIGSAARRLGRCAQDPRGGPALREVIPARAAPRMSLTSAALLNAATGKAQHAGWVAVFHALARTAQAVAAAQRSQHAAAWETQAATQAAEKVLVYAGRMDAAVSAATTPPPAAPAPAPAPDEGLTDAERNARDVMARRRTKTIRQIVDNAATSTTRTDRDQGGKKHDRGRGGPRR